MSGMTGLTTAAAAAVAIPVSRETAAGWHPPALRGLFRGSAFGLSLSCPIPPGAFFHGEIRIPGLLYRAPEHIPAARVDSLPRDLTELFVKLTGVLATQLLEIVNAERPKILERFSADGIQVLEAPGRTFSQYCFFASHSSDYNSIRQNILANPDLSE